MSVDSICKSPSRELFSYGSDVGVVSCFATSIVSDSKCLESSRLSSAILYLSTCCKSTVVPIVCLSRVKCCLSSFLKIFSFSATLSPPLYFISFNALSFSSVANEISFISFSSLYNGVSIIFSVVFLLFPEIFDQSVLNLFWSTDLDKPSLAFGCDFWRFGNDDEKLSRGWFLISPTSLSLCLDASLLTGGILYSSSVIIRSSP